MRRQLILMAVAFMGFKLLLANLPAVKCADADKENDDISSRNIFVGGLWHETTHKALRRYFQQYGEVEKAFVKIDENSGKNLGYGFVLMKDKEGADRVLQENPNHFIDGRFVDVNLASKPEDNKHLAAHLNSMNELPQSQKPNPNIDGQRANANLTSLRVNARNYKPLASRYTSMNPTPQFQVKKGYHQTEKNQKWRRKENPNTNIVGQTSNVPSAYLVANPHSNAPLASSSNSRNQQHSAPQNSHYMIFANEEGKFIQPGILHPPATQNSNYMIFDTPNGTLAHPLPNSTARQFQRSLTRHLSMLNSRAATGGQQPTTNVSIGQSSQTGSRRHAYDSTHQKHPTESEVNGRIIKSLQRPRSAPSVLQATGATSHNLSSYNNEQWFERYSVKRNKNERNNQQNIVFDTDKNKKDSTVKDKKSIEKESEIIENNAAKRDDPKHASFGNTENLVDNEPENVSTSHSHSGEKKKERKEAKETGMASKDNLVSTNVEDKNKKSWADMAEDEEQMEEKVIKEQEEKTQASVLKSTSEHHPTMAAKTHKATGEKGEIEAGKTNVNAIVEHHKHEKYDHKNDEDEKVLTIKEFPKIHEKTEMMYVDRHMPADKDHKIINENADNVIENVEVPPVVSGKSYLNAFQTSPSAAEKVKMVHSLVASTSKGGAEDAIKKKNLTYKDERKKQESDDKRKLFVGNLPKSATDEILRLYFEQFGGVKEAIVIRDPNTQESLGFGIVTMNKAEDAHKALNNPPKIYGRILNVEAYDASKRKNKHLATTLNSPDQLLKLQRGKKENQDQIIEDQMPNLNMADNKHFPALSIIKEEKHFDRHLPAQHSDKLTKDNANIPYKSDQVPDLLPKLSFLNVAKTSSTSSKNNNMEHPASTSKIEKADEAIKNKNLANTIKTEEKSVSVNGDKDSRRLYVGGLSYETTDATLRQYFEQFGPIEEVRVKTNEQTGKSRGFGFVTMRYKEDADSVLNYPYPIIIDNWVAKVELAKPRKENAPIGKIENLTHVEAENVAFSEDSKLIGRKGDHKKGGDSIPNKNKFSTLEINENDGSKTEKETKNEDKEPKKEEQYESSTNLVKSGRHSYASALLKKKSEDQPTKAAQTHMATEESKSEVEKTSIVANDEHNKTEQMPQHAENIDTDEMPTIDETATDPEDELGEGNKETEGNSSLHVPIHPSSSQEQEKLGENRRGTKKGNKKTKKGDAKNVGSGGNNAEISELANLGDSENQKKSTKAGSSSDVMAKAAEKSLAERVMKRAKYLSDSLNQFQFQIGKFLNPENLVIANPETNSEYTRLLNDALSHLNGAITREIIKLIRGGLQERRLKYIRLIGAGSLRQKNALYIFDKEMREEEEAAMELEFLRKGVFNGYYFDKIYRQQRQIFAIYQLALTKRIADLFKPKHVTVEDIHFDEDDSEEQFLTKEYEYTKILSDDINKENLVDIPSQVKKMDSADVTLIIMLNCPAKMTTDLIESYGENYKQLILIESSMHNQYDKKHPNYNDRERNRQKFQIRKPLPAFLTDHVFKQKDVSDVQICYANVKKN